MKAIRNVAVVALLAATPLAFADRGHGQAGGEGCEGMQSSMQGKQERHAGRHGERHARMAAMHQGMHQGMQGGEGRAHRHGAEPAPQPETKQ